MSAFSQLPDLALQQIWDGIAARSLHGDRITLGVVELDPGAVVAEHQHPNEQLGILLRGAMTFRVGGETRELGPGGTWRIPADVPHWAQAGPDGAVVVDVFSPPRNDWAGFAHLDPRPPRWPG
jgi:unsaturated pyranuronate lyase